MAFDGQLPRLDLIVAVDCHEMEGVSEHEAFGHGYGHESWVTSQG